MLELMVFAVVLVVLQAIGNLLMFKYLMSDRVMDKMMDKSVKMSAKLMEKMEEMEDKF